MTDLLKYGINTNQENIESKVVYEIACVFLLLEKHIMEYLKDYNLTLSQFNALMIIKHVGKSKGLSQVEISEKIIISPSNMTRLLDKLKREGLVERFPSPEDRRVNLIKITSKGSGLLDTLWPGYSKKVQKIMNLMKKEELYQISALMSKMFCKLDQDI